MIKKLSIVLLAVAMVFGSACNLDLLDNPNAVTSQNTDLNYLLNRIQIDYSTHFNQFSDPGMRLTRMLNQGAAIYDNAVSPGGRDGSWNTAYAGILADVQALIPLAETAKLFAHAGAARIIRASVLLTMVDSYGDIPYSDALNAENFNPKTDAGADVYAAALAELDKGIANMAATSSGKITSDLYYGGDQDKWTRLANTLKLKAQLNRRLIDKAGATTAINGLIAGAKLISAPAQNFVFNYSTSQTNPDTRHPRYSGGYSATGGGDYQSNSYMGTIFSSKGVGLVDPRMRFYFYRQVGKNATDINQIRCIGNQKPAHYGASDVYCFPTTLGYWGRDHLSNEGIPPDGLLRTQWGLYPAGGRYDDDVNTGVALVTGAAGKGYHPILMQSFVDFMLSESALTLGTTGDARALLKSGIEKSMADVRSLAMGSTEAGKITAFEASKTYVWATEVTKYVDKVLADYDAAATADAKLNIIGTEYWIAAHGNGIEMYNLYRRTGKPANQQPGLDPNPGGFVRSYYYPTAFVARNSSAKQKGTATTPVFWDNNPATLTK